MMRRSSRAGLLTSMVCAVLVAWAVACYRPTEVVVQITTDHACDADPRDGGAAGARILTAIKVGAVTAGDDPVTELPQCTTRPNMASDIGSLVIVPSGARDARVNIQVLMTTTGAPTKECTAPVVPFHCIVARRSVAFIEHESLRIPVRLYDACRGVTCAGETTCGKTGACESAVVNDKGCTGEATGCEKENDEPPADAGRDVSDAPIVNVNVDAGPTPPPACDGPKQDNVVAPVPRHIPLPGVGGAPPHLLASNTTHLIWTEPASTAGVAVRRVAKSGLGLIDELYVFNGGDVTALAADDSRVWVATQEGEYRINLGGAGPTSTQQLAIRGDVKGIAVSPAPASMPFFSTGTGGAGVVRDATTTPPSDLIDSVGGDLIAVSTSHIFTASAKSASVIRRAWPTASPGVVPIGTGKVVGLAADGAMVFVSELALPGGAFGRVSRYGGSLPAASLGVVPSPSALWVDETSFYVIDDPYNPDPPTTIASVRRGPRSASTNLADRITPLYSTVSSLAIDKGAGCVYLIAFDGAANKLRVFPKTGPAR